MIHAYDIRVRVTAIEEVAARTKRFRLEPVTGGALPQFAGGAHITVALGDDDGAMRNPYTLSGSPQDRGGYEITVLRTPDSRGGSAFLHEDVKIGRELSISAPINLFPINFLGRRHLLIAGGIGITPFLSMTEQLGDIGQHFELHYAMSRSGGAPYESELRSRLGRRFHRYCSDRGERINLESLLEGQPLGTHLYVCGPERLINAAIDTATGLGWPAENIHFERFAGPPPGDPFAVRLAKSGETILVGQHQTLLEALERAGVEPPSLCRGGACGQCELPVLSADGQLLHYDHFLSEEARASGRTIMTCVSRLKGRELVLDF